MGNGLRRPVRVIYKAILYMYKSIFSEHLTQSLKFKSNSCILSVTEGKKNEVKVFGLGGLVGFFSVQGCVIINSLLCRKWSFIDNVCIKESKQCFQIT